MSDGNETCTTESDIIFSEVCARCGDNCNSDEMVGDLCCNCGGPATTFAALNLGDKFLTEHDGRTIVFRKFSIGHAQVVRDPKGVWTGCQFPFGLLAPVKVEK